MSQRAATILLFGVFFLFLPIPFFLMGGVAWAPLLRLSALAGLMSVLGFVDGVEGLMAVALAVVRREVSQPGTEVVVDTVTGPMAARIVSVDR